MNESEWCDNYRRDLKEMGLAHNQNKMKYVLHPENAPYNHCYPPEYRYAQRTATQITPDKSDDIYYFLIDQYYLATGTKLFNNFQLKKEWRNRLNSLDWEEKTKSDFAKTFQKGTALLKRRRFQNVQEMIEFNALNQVDVDPPNQTGLNALVQNGLNALKRSGPNALNQNDYNDTDRNDSHSVKY